MPSTKTFTTHTVILDPNDKFPEAPEANLIEACGLLLPWAYEYFTLLTITPTLKAHMQNRYGFGELLPMKMTYHPDNHLSYPGDPDLHPLISIVQAEPTIFPLECHIYQYAIVAFIEGGSTFITRMD